MWLKVIGMLNTVIKFRINRTLEIIIQSNKISMLNIIQIGKLFKIYILTGLTFCFLFLPSFTYVHICIVCICKIKRRKLCHNYSWNRSAASYTPPIIRHSYWITDTSRYVHLNIPKWTHFLQRDKQFAEEIPVCSWVKTSLRCWTLSRNLLDGKGGNGRRRIKKKVQCAWSDTGRFRTGHFLRQEMSYGRWGRVLCCSGQLLFIKCLLCVGSALEAGTFKDEAAV